MSAQGKINSLRAGTANREIMEWAANQLEAEQEPVAWFKKLRIWVECPKDDKDAIPLYTTPQLKELSDEEIIKLANENGMTGWNYEISFARAILKKASEK